jgi:hypothetical protein
LDVDVVAGGDVTPKVSGDSRQEGQLFCTVPQ